MNDIFNLNGKVAIITGGYGHLGAAMARALLNYNAKVIIAGRSYDKYKEAFETEEHEKMVFRELDIMKEESFGPFMNSIKKEFGKIDILINNAFSISSVAWNELSGEDWKYTIDGVLLSVQRGIVNAAPNMIENNSGKILNISSMYGLVSPDFELYEGENCEHLTNPPHYGVAKAAIIQLTRYYASLYGKFNIQVNAIAPGPFPNPEIQNLHPQFIKRLKQKNPLKAIGKPDDIAGTAILLCSNASDFITGQTIQIDGGWTIN